MVLEEVGEEEGFVQVDGVGLANGSWRIELRGD